MKRLRLAIGCMALSLCLRASDQAPFNVCRHFDQLAAATMAGVSPVLSQLLGRLPRSRPRQDVSSSGHSRIKILWVGSTPIANRFFEKLTGSKTPVTSQKSNVFGPSVAKTLDTAPYAGTESIS